MDTEDDQTRRAEHDESHPSEARPVRSSSWREGVLTRAAELEALLAWVTPPGAQKKDQTLADSVRRHLVAAREAVGKKRWRWLSGKRARFERATSNLDAAEADLLLLAVGAHVIPQFEGLAIT